MNKILLIQKFNTIAIQLQLQNVIWLSKETLKKKIKKKKRQKKIFFFDILIHQLIYKNINNWINHKS